MYFYYKLMIPQAALEAAARAHADDRASLERRLRAAMEQLQGAQDRATAAEVRASFWILPRPFFY